jgi:hypothetical protein
MGQPPQIIELPDKQGMVTSPGEVIFRLHNSGRHLFPLGTKKAARSPAGFSCPNCGADIQRVMTKGGSTVLTCHCLIALLHKENQDFDLGWPIWIQWIAQAWSSEQKQLRTQSN